ncbi:urea amidolyase associated protein UAAP1 [Acinetobacter sp. CFCC 10889]|uniref:urea amidolyase associated protein UAAP1 n=1 Tax=Acinetobacter sp. CFCC 10889 TaxID=1775557 RepID=UPI000DD09A8F|nr:urea amidolyase associated protein UAAP1 [Acinetobacter sp. CFCC 10889]
MSNIHQYHHDQALWTELLPGGHHWSARIQRGAVLQLKALGAHANVSLFCVNAEDKLERFNMPDSLKAQHTAFLSTGHILASDLGRAMISIVKDDHGWNDAFCAPSTSSQIEKQFGTKTFQDARNAMFRNAKDSLILEMTKFGLGATDLSATLNLFSKVAPDDAGNLSYISTDNHHQIIELRFEMDCLVFLSSAPHGLDIASTYQPADVQLSLFKANSLSIAHDVCRDSCPQNQRAFQNNNRYYALSA